MLRIDHLCLAAGGFRLQADFTLDPGARLALIGPSGGGKSSLLLAIAGFLPPKRGRVLWHGQDLTPLPPARRPVATLFQDQNLFPHLTVEQNLGLALNPDLRLTVADRARIAGVLDRLGLTGMQARRPAELSGGQAARAALGRVLLQARPVLLLDEPFAALGPGMRAEMLDLVGELADETEQTIILVSHDPDDARRFAELTALVADGQVASPRPTDALFAAPPPALAAYLGV